MDDQNSIIQAQKEQIARYQTRLKGKIINIRFEIKTIILKKLSKFYNKLNRCGDSIQEPFE